MPNKNSAAKNTSNINKIRGLTWLALFTSTSTIICCALPIMLVSLGMGATVASMISSLPFLVSLSLHKALVFGFSALMLLLAAWVLYRPNRSCPVDPALNELCGNTQHWNRRLYWLSVILWCIGFFAAFLALPITKWLEG